MNIFNAEAQSRAFVKARYPIFVFGLVVFVQGIMEPFYAEFRAQHKLSQTDLALAVGVSRKTISTIETERFTPSISIALRIAKKFNVTVEDIFQLKS